MATMDAAMAIVVVMDMAGAMATVVAAMDVAPMAVDIVEATRLVVADTVAALVGAVVVSMAVAVTAAVADGSFADDLR